MTRLTRYFLPTEKQAPADAEALSHKLMVRAGLVRQVGAGLWSWLPAGWRVHQKVVQIVREEIDAIGGQEMLMPVLNPAELWQRSGRYYAIGDELFRLQDRRGADMVLAMTHEEVVTTHVAQVVRSYRDLPLILYHFQIKERDEPRPRAGVLRTREFIMKDSYTFDRDAEGLDVGYEKHREAYDRIFDRAGLEWYRVESDVGMMGGTGAHEYMAPCPAGENDVALAPGYAANVEIARAQPQAVHLPDGLRAPEEVATPGLTTVADVTAKLGVEAGTLLKAYPIVVDDRGLTLVLVRGDHRVNDIKLRNALGAGFRPAREEEFADRIGPAGYIGPVGADAPILLDDAVAPGAYITGANRDGHHLRGVEPGRDFPFKRADVRRVEEGDTVDGNAIRIEPAIEIGNIFKLGTRYSEPLGATYLDEAGVARPVWMGSYGIGPARIAAAAVEQFADEHGISWPRAIAPFDVHLVGLGKPGTEEHALAERLYEELQEAGFDVIYDDRDAGPGEKFADAELLGVPLRLTIGRRTLAAGEIEVQVRRGRESRSLPLEGAAQAALEMWRSLP
ncbi:proline--tRNA ligase [Candidatus Solirubrobacter pratensis]|uniref:proline--tRNA ligase n=1 Tax=Candidatus Solirubrobacter pratensis TaxID=1298857 RepID=UPI0004101EB2|nr:proline--tRNA ligase [Candidatus Solirubrobacter pratensis]